MSARSRPRFPFGRKRRVEHFVVTNFNIHRNDGVRDRNGAPVRTPEWLEERFTLFERFCLPSMVAQTCQEFTWLVRWDSAGTPPPFRERLRAHEAACPNMRLIPESTSFPVAIANVLGSRSCRLLTTRLDNDDGFHRMALERLQRHARGRELAFLNFPVGYCLAYPNGEVRLFEYANNPFLSLAEDYDGERPRTATCVGHPEARRVAPVRQLEREPSWLQVIHGRNIRNVLKGRPCDPPDLLEAFNAGGKPVRP